jgi:hypothetical protein
VTRADADAMAAALERSKADQRPDQPDPRLTEAFDAYRKSGGTTADYAAWMAALQRSRGGQHYYEDAPGLVDEFIAYCKGGGFEIW